MRLRLVPFAGALAAGALAGAPRAAAAQDYVVIVNASNSATALPRNEVAALFLKQVTSWPDGSPVVVVDQPERSPARAAFSRSVLGRPARAISSYWQQQVFNGRDVPPTQRTSDADVVAFVKSNPDAIGYVSRAASLDTSVRAVKVIAR
jgi:ABC-type phosphate transport system substrate-binding protein